MTPEQGDLFDSVHNYIKKSKNDAEVKRVLKLFNNVPFSEYLVDSFNGIVRNNTREVFKYQSYEGIQAKAFVGNLEHIPLFAQISSDGNRTRFKVFLYRGVDLAAERLALQPKQVVFEAVAGKITFQGRETPKRTNQKFKIGIQVYPRAIHFPDQEQRGNIYTAIAHGLATKLNGKFGFTGPYGTFDLTQSVDKANLDN